MKKCCTTFISTARYCACYISGVYKLVMMYLKSLCQQSRCGDWLQGFSFNFTVLTQGQPALSPVAAAAVLEILCPLAMAMGQKQGMRNMPKHHNAKK